MTEPTQTTETKTAAAPHASPTWQAVIEESNEPPPQKYMEKISITLDPEERLEIGLKYTDAVKKRARFADQTKQIMSARKSDLARLEADEKELGEAFSTGRVEREVEVIEYKSLRLGKTWKVRKDTGEHFDERALTIQEREELTPRSSAKQLSLADAAKSSPTAVVPKAEESATASTTDTEGATDEDEEPDSDGTSITDPETLLEDASDEDDGDDAS